MLVVWQCGKPDDGLDGLAILPTVMVGGGLGLIAYLVGNSEYSTYLYPYIPGTGEFSVFCGALIAGLGFLYQYYPAKCLWGMSDLGA